MSRRIINVAVLAISLAMLTGVVCAPPPQTLTPAEVCTALTNCPEYSSVLAQNTLFKIGCPIALKIVQNRDATCYSCLAQNSCNWENCLDSCSTMIDSVGQFGSLFSTLGVPTYQATEASNSSEGDVLPAP